MYGLPELKSTNIVEGREQRVWKMAPSPNRKRDLQPTRGNPDWHYQQDIKPLLLTRWFDLIILHPDCTKLALSGNRWYGRGMPRHQERLDSIEWTIDLWKLAKKAAPLVALENPSSPGSLDMVRPRKPD